MAVGFGLAGLIEYVSADVYYRTASGGERVIEPEYFGTHIHRLVLNPGEQALKTPWPDVPIGGIRLWDSGVLWAEVNPGRDTWDFGRMDAYVSQAVAHGVSVLYVLGGTPRWASARPDERCPYGSGCAAEPARMSDWESYVREVVRRYRGRIGAYELWNEPAFSDIPSGRDPSSIFFSGSAASMVEMARIARKVLDEEDPQAWLLTPGFVGEPDSLELFLSLGGKRYVQAVAYHFYSSDADDFIRQIAGARQVMARNAVAQLPLWDTETGTDAFPQGVPSSPGEQSRRREQAAQSLAQYLILGAAAGLERFFHYAWDNPRTGMIGPHGEILPNAEVVRKVRDWLAGSSLGSCVKCPGSVTLCEGSKGAGAFSILWAQQETAYAVPIPKGDVYLSRELALGGSEAAASVSANAVNVRLTQTPLMIRFSPANSHSGRL